MPLTPTQRDFMVKRLQLQVHPRKEKRVRAMTNNEVLTRDLNKALDQCLPVESELLVELGKLQAMRGTESLSKPLETEIAKSQQRLKNAQRSGGTAQIAQVQQEYTNLKLKVADAMKVAKLGESTFAKIDDAQQALDQLKRHAQADHVSAQITTATDKIAEARREAADGTFDKARNAMHAANGAIEDGTRFADGYATYLPKRAVAGRAIGSLVRWIDRTDKLTEADQNATPAVGKYAEASSSMDTQLSEIKDIIRDRVIEPRTQGLTAATLLRDELRVNLAYVPAGRFAALKADKAVSVIDADVDKATQMERAARDHLAANRCAEAVATAMALDDVVSLAQRAGERRKAYDLQRRQTLDRMNTLVNSARTLKDGPNPLLGHLFSMQELVKKADRLASRESMRMEDGVAELKAIEVTVGQLATVANEATGYLNARVLADERFEKLQKLPQAGALDEQIGGVRKLLDEAANATGIVSAHSIVKSGDMEDHLGRGQNWGAALALVKQADAQMAAAETLAPALGDALALQNEVSGATDKPKALELVNKLREQAKDARSKPHADLVDFEFREIDSALREATRLAEADDAKGAQAFLDTAATLLLAAKTVQSEQPRYVSARTPIELRGNNLATIADPPAAKIQKAIDPVTEALKAAAEAASKRDWNGAHAQLAQATEAADHADLVARLRREFNTAYNDLETKRLLMADPAKTEAADVMQRAMQAADALNFDHANRFLANMKARLAGERVKALAATPNDPNFLLEVEKMLAASGGEELLARATDSPMQLRNKDKITEYESGKDIAYGKQVKSGPELLDEIVANLPEDVHPKTLMLLAQKRFGIDLRVSGLYEDNTGTVKEGVSNNPDFLEDDGYKNYSKRVKSGKKLYEMLALVPEQAKDNPSMSRVERRNALQKDKDGNLLTTPDSGGFYQSRDNANAGKGLVVLSGRPGESFQKFGANEKNGTEPMLPPIEPGYEPADDTDVDYFDFATVHEVGHAVDDRMGFMAARGKDPAFGGWITYGGDLKEVIDLVAETFGYDDTPEQKQYIADLMANAKPVPPKPPERERVAWEEARKRVDEWHAAAASGRVWWDQGQTNKATIGGRVYQEAYKGTWVSYLAAARSKGLTGYQFRAPAEWFAELYAGYHCGKLKKGHPARQWLASLSL